MGLIWDVGGVEVKSRSVSGCGVGDQFGPSDCRRAVPLFVYLANRALKEVRVMCRDSVFFPERKVESMGLDAGFIRGKLRTLYGATQKRGRFALSCGWYYIAGAFSTAPYPAQHLPPRSPRRGLVEERRIAYPL